MPSVASASVASPVVGTFSSTSLFPVSFSTKEIKHVNYEKKDILQKFKFIGVL